MNVLFLLFVLFAVCGGSRCHYHYDPFMGFHHHHHYMGHHHCHHHYGWGGHHHHGRHHF